MYPLVAIFFDTLTFRRMFTLMHTGTLLVITELQRNSNDHVFIDKNVFYAVT